MKRFAQTTAKVADHFGVEEDLVQTWLRSGAPDQVPFDLTAIDSWLNEQDQFEATKFLVGEHHQYARQILRITTTAFFLTLTVNATFAGLAVSPNVHVQSIFREVIHCAFIVGNVLGCCAFCGAAYQIHYTFQQINHLIGNSTAFSRLHADKPPKLPLIQRLLGSFIFSPLRVAPSNASGEKHNPVTVLPTNYCAGAFILFSVMSLLAAVLWSVFLWETLHQSPNRDGTKLGFEMIWRAKFDF